MKSKIFKTSIALAMLLVVFSNACKKDDDSVDCSKVSGATFTTNGGKIANILETKCATATCHGAGGEGAAHWEWAADYATVQPHFEHMLEAVEDGSMPEAGAVKLTDEEKDQLECWKNSGFLE